MSADERMAYGYEPRFDIDYAVGEQGELYVGRILDALGTERVEVKTDERALLTHRVFLEVQCTYRGQWQFSGIARTSSEFWAHVIGEAVILAPTHRVREIARHYWRHADQTWSPTIGTAPPHQHLAECRRGSHPTRGVVLDQGMYLVCLTRGIPGARGWEA